MLAGRSQFFLVREHVEGSAQVPAGLRRLDDVVKVGDMIKVKVINVDDTGRIKLSRKALLKDEETDGADKSEETVEA